MDSDHSISKHVNLYFRIDCFTRTSSAWLIVFKIHGLRNAASISFSETKARHDLGGRFEALSVAEESKLGQHSERPLTRLLDMQLCLVCTTQSLSSASDIVWKIWNISCLISSLSVSLFLVVFWRLLFPLSTGYRYYIHDW